MKATPNHIARYSHKRGRGPLFALITSDTAVRRFYCIQMPLKSLAVMTINTVDAEIYSYHLWRNWIPYSYSQEKNKLITRLNHPSTININEDTHQVQLEYNYHCLSNLLSYVMCMIVCFKWPVRQGVSDQWSSDSVTGLPVTKLKWCTW